MFVLNIIHTTTGPNMAIPRGFVLFVLFTLGFTVHTITHPCRFCQPYIDHEVSDSFVLFIIITFISVGVTLKMLAFSTTMTSERRG